MAQAGLFNTKARYGLVAQLFHWAIALMILFLLPLGLYMHELPISTSNEIAEKVWFYSLHKSVGMIVLCLAILRIVWAFFSEKPAPMHPERKAETLAAETVHWMLYISILLVPLVGYVHHAASVGFAPIWGPFPDGLPIIPKSQSLADYTGLMHFVLATIMFLSILAHIAGALKHTVLERDGVLSRMIPFKDFPAGILPLAETRHKKNTGLFYGATVLFALAFLGGWGVHLYGQTSGQITAQVGSGETRATSDQNSDVSGNRAPRWVVNSDASELAITIQQMGAPVKGIFGEWQADIFFDPESLETSSTRVVINTGSLSLGGVTSQAISSDFLNAEKHPTAVFVGNNFSTDETGYVVAGALQILGTELPFEFPFTLEIEDTTARMAASTVINRMQFGVGEAGFADESSVGFDVIVDISLTAQRVE